MDLVVLVDRNDHDLGTMEKLQAHQLGLLHRAFSVFIFNSKNELLIHKRAEGKYHSGGLWTNSCCSHPFPNEHFQDAAIRRVKQELGMTISGVDKVGILIYKVALDNNLTEHEYDYILVTQSDEIPNLNPEEASDYKYQTIDSIKQEMQEHPDRFTFWFKQIILEGNYF